MANQIKMRRRQRKETILKAKSQSFESKETAFDGSANGPLAYSSNDLSLLCESFILDNLTTLRHRIRQSKVSPWFRRNTGSAACVQLRSVTHRNIIPGTEYRCQPSVTIVEQLIDASIRHADVHLDARFADASSLRQHLRWCIRPVQHAGAERNGSGVAE